MKGGTKRNRAKKALKCTSAGQGAEVVTRRADRAERARVALAARRVGAAQARVRAVRALRKRPRKERLRKPTRRIGRRSRQLKKPTTAQGAVKGRQPNSDGDGNRGANRVEDAVIVIVGARRERARGRPVARARTCTSKQGNTAAGNESSAQCFAIRSGFLLRATFVGEVDTLGAAVGAVRARLARRATFLVRVPAKKDQPRTIDKRHQQQD